ncbi:hypothetical protein EPUS_04264 [Endocarpon pusillum Z07020]|uniref:Arf-GAP domain-containing protein n=1 Tax=Endocarpon pusillum (strain Z07020 / HMAS-L-300199) TaxID=1263415 RepID=U1HU61_ENDPU|nr:uncharacterized protein EPUS_04264 [Endocarpon pusillum Z07020]ERF72829.1 hypothetical protein EPUS_04264 [Endocarpon pusillum Z07020]
MSRRAGSERAAENQQTIKNLLKLEGNKVCADCKKNKHPRWASWNIGVFICIRCSGIHRGMGTHISRVKSVELDAWTDEQLQSVLRWGNSRANKYWEAKLAAGHMPSEAKIENFIRTKYESKRWVMEGPMPDPSVLDEDGDDDVPLSLVQEKAKIERSASEKQRAVSNQTQSQRRPAPAIDLFDEDNLAPPVRPSTTDNASIRPQPKSAIPTTSRQTKPGDSLLGLDFFGNVPSSGPARPSSANSNPVGSTGQSRPDLKQSILSLYSSAPKAEAQPQPHNRQPSFGGTAPPIKQPQDAFGGLADAFGGLSFANPEVTASSRPRQQAKSSFSATGAFAASAPVKSAPSAPQLSSPPPLVGGGFFDSLPSRKPEQPKSQAPAPRKPSHGPDFALTQPLPSTSRPQEPTSQDHFAEDDFAGFASADPPPVPQPAKIPSSSPSSTFNSAFNLSAPPAPPPKPNAASKPPPLVSQNSSAIFDPWSSAHDNTAWGTSEPTPAPSKPKAPTVDIGKPPTHITPNDISSGWGEPITSSQKPGQNPSITADEDYGGWTSASNNQTPTASAAKPSGGFAGASDPFDNPWG